MTKKAEKVSAACPSCKSDNVQFAPGGAIRCGSCGKSLEPFASDETDGELAERKAPATALESSRGAHGFSNASTGPAEE
jgi:ribosomal protein L37AE/L43A